MINAGYTLMKVNNFYSPHTVAKNEMFVGYIEINILYALAKFHECRIFRSLRIALSVVGVGCPFMQQENIEHSSCFVV